MPQPSGPDYWENRALLKDALTRAYKDGLFWKDDANHRDWSSWEERTRRLIEAALGPAEAAKFMVDWRSSSTDVHLTGLNARHQHLFDLIRRVDSLQRLELRSGFDGRDWVSRY